MARPRGLRHPPQLDAPRANSISRHSTSRAKRDHPREDATRRGPAQPTRVSRGRSRGWHNVSRNVNNHTQLQRNRDLHQPDHQAHKTERSHQPDRYTSHPKRRTPQWDSELPEKTSPIKTDSHSSHGDPARHVLRNYDESPHNPHGKRPSEQTEHAPTTTTAPNKRHTTSEQRNCTDDILRRSLIQVNRANPKTDHKQIAR